MLLARADVLLEGFRPGVMARLGLDYDAVRAINPRIVYCSITGYGQSGPKAQRAGHDLSYIAQTGLLALSTGHPETPTVPPVLIADLMGGAYPAVMSVVMALFRRERTGEGACIDISMTEGLFLPMFWAWAQGLSTGVWPGSGGHLFTGGSPRYRIYPAADGGLVAVAALEDKFWAAFCDAIGLSGDMRKDEADAQSVVAAVGQLIAADTSDRWREVFARVDCCVSVVNTLQEALRDPHFAPLATAGNTPTRRGALPALPMPFASLLTPSGDARTAPELGEANAGFGFPPLPR